MGLAVVAVAACKIHLESCVGGSGDRILPKVVPEDQPVYSEPAPVRNQVEVMGPNLGGRLAEPVHDVWPVRVVDVAE